MKLLRALIVGADRDERRQLAKLLDASGFHSVEAEDGMSALQFGSPDGIDLIVSDVRLTELDGPHFVDLVLDGAFGRRPPPLILCAATLHERVWVAKLALTGVTALAMPFTPDAFVSALDTAFPVE